MKYFKGTPSPWFVENTGYYFAITVSNKVYSHALASTQNNEYTIPKITTEVQLANANLIASAPELLENLIICVNLLESEGFQGDINIERAKEAINKALGL